MVYASNLSFSASTSYVPAVLPAVALTFVALSSACITPELTPFTCTVILVDPPHLFVLLIVKTSLSTYPVPPSNKVTVADPFAATTTLTFTPEPEPPVISETKLLLAASRRARSIVLNGWFILPPLFVTASEAFKSDWLTCNMIFVALLKSGLLPPIIVPFAFTISPFALMVNLFSPAVENDISSSPELYIPVLVSPSKLIVGVPGVSAFANLILMPGATPPLVTLVKAMLRLQYTYDVFIGFLATKSQYL